TTRRAPSAVETSAATPTVPAPMSDAARSTVAGSRPLITTSAPSAAARWATARPMPRVEPVTTVTRPSRRPCAIASLVSVSGAPRPRTSARSCAAHAYHFPVPGRLRLRDSLSPLANRRYRILWAGQTVSAVGDGLTRVAMAYAVLGVN